MRRIFNADYSTLLKFPLYVTLGVPPRSPPKFISQKGKRRRHVQGIRRARLFFGEDAAMMKVTKSPHASESPHHTKGTETVCWITVWILLGLVCLTIVILLAKISG
jgi:hypothetical protein